MFSQDQRGQTGLPRLASGDWGRRRLVRMKGSFSKTPGNGGDVGHMEFGVGYLGKDGNGQGGGRRCSMNLGRLSRRVREAIRSARILATWSMEFPVMLAKN